MAVYLVLVIMFCIVVIGLKWYIDEEIYKLRNEIKANYRELKRPKGEIEKAFIRMGESFKDLGDKL